MTTTATRERPIIFSPEMARAILDGRKTQTRRVLKPQPFESGFYDGDVSLDQVFDGAARFSATAVGGGVVVEHVADLRFAPGDRLWVRETVCAVEHEDGTDAVEYLADASCARIKNTLQAADQWLALYHYGRRGPDRRNREGQTVPPIHMPRWASRLTLTVTDVRVQRVQEISEADAIAEGIADGGCTQCGGSSRADPPCCYAPSPDFRDSFAHLWNSIHDPDAWHRNDWLAAISFDVHRCNIDEMPEGDE